MSETLIVRLPNWLGDTIMAVPALRALRARYPDARLALAGPWATLLAGQDLGDVLVPYPRSWGGRLAKWDTLRALDAEIIVLLPNSLEAAIAARYWGGRRRVGFDADGRRGLLTDAIAMPEPRRHQVDEYLLVVERLAPSAGDGVPRLEPPPPESAERETARALLGEIRLASGGGRLIGIHLGAAFGAAKLWPTVRVAELCRILAARGDVPVLLGAPGDLAVARRVEDDTGARSLVGRDRPEILGAVLVELEALVSGDTGVGHLAAALGTPVVALFGPTDPRLSAPRGPARALAHPVPCAPCFYRTCPIEHPCMRGLGVDRVRDALDDVLASARTGAAMTEPSTEPSRAPLTILHLVANRWWTGSADPVLRLLEGLRRRGHRPILGVILGDRFEARAREAGFDPIAGLSLTPHVAPVAFVRDVVRLRRLVRTERVDVIHAHHSHDHWLAALVRGRRDTGRRLPIARTFHNLRSVRSGRLEGRLYRRTQTVFAVSRQIETRCREIGLPVERVVWTPGIADLPRFVAAVDAAPIRDEFNLGAAPVVVSVSRLAANRGHELLLNAFRLLLATLPEARLLLVGKGETRTRLEQTVAEMGLGGQVIFTGYRDRDLPAVLAAADCFALMAAGSDDSCRAALEAMAAARPVVARRVGALPETIAHGETGLLVDEDRPEAVARALAAVLTDRGRAQAMGRAGRQRATTEFSAERAVAIVEQAYRDLV